MKRNEKAKRLLWAFRGLPKGSTIVEIGCVRRENEVPSDGYSTVYLAREAVTRGWIFHSIDIDQTSVSIARGLVSDYPTVVHKGEGARTLKRLDLLVSGLYLDGSADPGEALKQYRAARLAPRAVVVIDDAQRLHGRDFGKAADLVSQLFADGFRVRFYDTEPGYRMAVAKRWI